MRWVGCTTVSGSLSTLFAFYSVHMTRLWHRISYAYLPYPVAYTKISA